MLVNNGLLTVFSLANSNVSTKNIEFLKTYVKPHMLTSEVNNLILNCIISLKGQCNPSHIPYWVRGTPNSYLTTRAPALNKSKLLLF